jgi:hypothetical protein
MTNSSASVKSQPCARPYLTTSVAAASAGILAAGLVSVPTEVDVARTEVRAVQLAAFPLAQGVAAILEQAAGDQRGNLVAVPSSVVSNAAITTPLTFARDVQPTDSATQVIDPAIDSQQVTNADAAAGLGDITDPILGSIVGVGVFFVFIPAFWALIIVISAINVVLDAVGLPLLPNVLDPPFGPTPPVDPAIASTVESKSLSGDPVALETNKKFAATGPAELDPPSDAPVVPKTRKNGSSTDTVETDSPSLDSRDTDTETASTSKPLTNVTKDSPDFTPKRRDHEDSSADSAASTVEQHPVGNVDKKPKPDAAEGEQKAGDDDPSPKRSAPRSDARRCQDGR